MKISHPRFLSPGNHEEDLATEFPDCLKKSDEGNIVQQETNRGSSVFAFPKVRGKTFSSSPKPECAYQVILTWS